MKFQATAKNVFEAIKEERRESRSGPAGTSLARSSADPPARRSAGVRVERREQSAASLLRRRTRMWGWGPAFKMRAMRRECEEGEDDDELEDFFKIDSKQLIDEMGISGMCVLNPKVEAGISGIPLKYTLLALALQAWFLQFVILYYMATVLVPRPNADQKKSLPILIIFAATYLHFLKCITNFPYSLILLVHLHEFHDHFWDRIVAVPVFFMDAMIVPLCSLVIGALYLCTSVTVADVILNSCAVAFMGEIDNWILTLNSRLNELGRCETGGAVTIYMPIAKDRVMICNWLLCTVPIVPCIFSLVTLHIGMDVMKL